MSRPISDPVFDIGRDLQRAYDDGYKQGRYDEKVGKEMSLPSGESTHAVRSDTISRAEAVKAICGDCVWYNTASCEGEEWECDSVNKLRSLPSAEPNKDKYERHYDHTDCLWYHSNDKNECPSTCAQYRDGWNDAMDYIFHGGEGYRPYRRGEEYEE